ncbi:hypothetical protein, partial [Salmonella sp. s54836]|uniref:hypothetical protein n=1 Tax=Salmonella sp. s54836 TaxID=3159673 RepID=UPI00397ECA81
EQDLCQTKSNVVGSTQFTITEELSANFLPIRDFSVSYLTSNKKWIGLKYGYTVGPLILSS